MAEVAFATFSAVVLVYVILDNYLYFAKVARALDEPPKLLPWN